LQVKFVKNITSKYVFVQHVAVNVVQYVADISPTFIVSPVSQTATQPNSVTMTCVTGYSAPPAVVQWIKNNVTLTQDQGQQAYSILGSSVIDGGAARISSRLLLPSVSLNDAGSYWCVAVNTMTQQRVLSSAATLTVNGRISLQS
jgi:hypothetical protein